MNAPFQHKDYEAIGKQVIRITGCMPAPRGMDVTQLSDGYFDALQAFPLPSIVEAVDGFLSGRFGERKWLPTPPELAVMVRSILPGQSGFKSGAGYSWFRQPNSPILKQNCEKEWARGQVRRGVYPKGSIWIPGCCVGENGKPARPDIGDLFGPDPNWRPARPLQAVPDDHLPEQTR